MIIEKDEDLAGLRRIGRVVAMAREEVIQNMQPGISTAELDAIAAQCLARYGARSAPILAYNFPGTTCISVNEEAAHGIPGKKVIQAGDMVNVDVSAELDGYFADTGATVIVGQGTLIQQRLCQCAQAALADAIAEAKAGNELNQIGKAIYEQAVLHGFTVIKNLCGHGTGRKLHEQPSKILNYYSRNDRYVLKEGLVLAIEPFISTRARSVKKASDGWTLNVPPGNYVAQFEHTVIVTQDKPIVLTTL